MYGLILAMCATCCMQAVKVKIHTFYKKQLSLELYSNIILNKTDINTI